MLKNRYVFDLDGTLALVDHRRPALAGDNPDWHSFNKASLLDPPNSAVVQVARALFDSAQGYELWITSGRSDSVELETRGWLQKHEVPFHRLLMRSASDSRADAVLKRELGMPGFQVAPGDF